MQKKKSISFDPNAAAVDGAGIFGLPYTEKDSLVVYLPVPWDVTTSYRPGTSRGPEAILDASYQMDLFDLEVEKPYEVGLFMLPVSKVIKKWNLEARVLAEKLIKRGGRIPAGKAGAALLKAQKKVNQFGAQLNDWVCRETARIYQDGKFPIIIGGDHSVPFGAIQAAAKVHKKIGILHLDAHSDMRNSYEGFEWSHASIMYNVLTKISGIQKIVQVGIRDFCEEEVLFSQSQGDHVQVFYDRLIQQKKLQGKPWAKISNDIIEALPEKVWISFDIDGLDPRYCPNTGTPVPGGIDFSEATYLIRELARSGRKIIGADLNEVAPAVSATKDQWDANVGMRLLYQMTAWLLVSQEKVKMRW